MTDRRTTALSTFAQHTITERHALDEKRAIFRLAPPLGTLGQFYEVQAAHWGHLICHGDWEPVVFGAGGPWKCWRSAIHWIGGTDDVEYYVAQKARVGSGRRWSAFDDRVARNELRRLMHERRITGRQARDISNAVDDGDQHHARELVSEYAQDGYEIAGDFGAVLAWPVWMAWAACKRLDQLLDAEEKTQ